MREESDWFTIILTFLLIPFAAVWHGFALKYLWLWFVVPLGVMEIGIAHAVGFSMVLSTFAKAKTGDVDGNIPEAMAKMALAPAVLLAFGAIIHAFM